MQIVRVETTVENLEAAKRLSGLVLGARLAACIQFESITSHYRWEGQVVGDDEVRVTLKTTLSARSSLFSFLEERHSYDVPEIVASVVEVSASYGAWVEAEVAHDGT